MEGKGEQSARSFLHSGDLVLRERSAAKSRPPPPQGEAPAPGDALQLPPPGAAVQPKGHHERDRAAKRASKKRAVSPAKKRSDEGVKAALLKAALPKAEHCRSQWPGIVFPRKYRIWLGVVLAQILLVLYCVMGLRASVRAQNSVALPAPAPGTRYSADWRALDSRPLPAWYDEAKVGIFVHWGVFSVPAFNSEWFWWHWQMNGTDAYRKFMAKNYRDGFTYPELAGSFRAELFDPDRWAELFRKAGARYVVLTSKHHEGYTLWPSKVSWNWNAADVGPKRDLVGELARAVRKAGGMRFGLYYSLYEWFNPHYQRDKAAGWTTDTYVRAKVTPELLDIVETYRPEIVWSDGDWEAPDTYWNSTQFLAWLYNDSPVRESVVVNDRWGMNTSCRHGDVYVCQDHYNPGKLVSHKWENALPLDKGNKKVGAIWGYRRNAQLAEYLTIEELIQELVSTVSCNGNLLFNIGPSSDGTISPLFEERLTQLGTWLRVNGEAVYGTRPWKYQQDPLAPHVWYTSKPETSPPTVYVFVLKWPKGGTLMLGALRLAKEAKITMLGAPKSKVSGSLQLHREIVGGEALAVNLPCLTPDIAPTPWAWVLKVEGAL